MEQKIYTAKEYTENELRRDLTKLGFDFSLIGSIYLQELLRLIINKPMLIFSLTTNAMVLVAEKYCKKTSSIDRDVRWTIKKAYSNGCFDDYIYFKAKMPTTKQVLVWLMDKYLKI